MVATRTQSTPQKSKSGWFGALFGGVGSFALWLLVALGFSILAEWVGQTWVWQKAGVQHSRNMLAAEIEHLDSDYGRALLTDDPAGYAQGFAETTYRGLVELTGLEHVLAWLAESPDPQGGRVQAALRSGYDVVEPYVLSALTITQVFAVRLAVLTLAMPVFFLFALVALVDGLVQRDLRRWGGGRESAFVYHHAKRMLVPTVILAWVIYLAMPVAVHPAWIIFPFAALNALAVVVAASTFKKYL
ncbi:TIGR03747 family integrating conjugative element membrane protein [Halorhodospira sp. 9622]|uniref:TIGR03747 family integrating conjugative element membrane protein n=1 Tax=Halorhodospira sp. 9622 TaxID=2899136 RepID=UPI001EE78BCE|nr:TIGR03747 family integrating conjugative element membrane protein [Halorhodospira sp. 9622]MCG5537357.1 TIGR03747 family integrating conjugative element membrane protein [Halorhodospira sp. 9622]